MLKTPKKNSNPSPRHRDSFQVSSPKRSRCDSPPNLKGEKNDVGLLFGTFHQQKMRRKTTEAPWFFVCWLRISCKMHLHKFDSFLRAILFIEVCLINPWTDKQSDATRISVMSLIWLSVPKLTKSKSKKQPPPDRQEALSGSQVVDIHSKDRGSTASWILNISSQFRIASRKSPRQRLLPKKNRALHLKCAESFVLNSCFTFSGASKICCHVFPIMLGMMGSSKNSKKNDPWPGTSVVVVVVAGNGGNVVVGRVKHVMLTRPLASKQRNQCEKALFRVLSKKLLARKKQTASDRTKLTTREFFSVFKVGRNDRII